MEQDRIKKLAGITEIEINPEDSMINSLDDIDKYVDMLEDDELDIREIQANLAHKIRNAVENIRNNLTVTNI